MLRQLESHAVRIVTGVAFFLFGFFVVANALDLADREIVVGLIAGFVGGVTMLVAVMRDERRQGHFVNPTVC
jgi:fluoride ion exporter CrcB/FEX